MPSNFVIGLIFTIFAFAFVSATVVGCLGRAEAVISHLMTNPEAPV